MDFYHSVASEFPPQLVFSLLSVLLVSAIAAVFCELIAFSSKPIKESVVALSSETAVTFSSEVGAALLLPSKLDAFSGTLVALFSEVDAFSSCKLCCPRLLTFGGTGLKNSDIAFTPAGTFLLLLVV